jgi:hypothetical protein
MNSTIHQIAAFWDPDVEVWVATSDAIPGLATEALTIEMRTQKLRMMIPELMDCNQFMPQGYTGSIKFELISRRQESIHIAA